MWWTRAHAGRCRLVSLLLWAKHHYFAGSPFLNMATASISTSKSEQELRLDSGGGPSAGGYGLTPEPTISSVGVRWRALRRITGLARRHELYMVHVLHKVKNDGRPTAAKNPADFLPRGGGERAGEGVAKRAG
jgi:hypothetical protein